MDRGVFIFCDISLFVTQPIRFSLQELVTDEMSVFVSQCLKPVLSDVIQKLDSHLAFLSFGFYNYY